MGYNEIVVDDEVIVKKTYSGTKFDGMIEAKEELDGIIESSLRKCGCKNCQMQYFDLFGKPMRELIHQ